MTIEETSSIDQLGFPILTILILLPVLAGAVLYLIRNQRTAMIVAAGAAAIELLLATFMALDFDERTTGVQYVERSGDLLGASWHVGVDGINVLFLPLIALLGLMVVVYAEYGKGGGARQLAALTLFLEATMIGAFATLDLVMFWVFFVLELVPSWFLISRWGEGQHRRKAANEYVGFMAVGAVLMIVAIVLIGRSYADVTGEGFSSNLLRLQQVSIPANKQTLIFFLMFFGFAIKAPIFPFHTWMPKVLEQGPIVTMSVFLVGIKLGTYGLLRFVIPLVETAAEEYFWLMATLGGVSVIYGALLAFAQTDLRRMIAYASLSHAGMILIGLFSLNLDGFEGGLLQMINLGIVGAGLFFVAGFLVERVHSSEVDDLGGVIHHAPLLTGAFLLIALAGVGLPGTNGFNGEHLIMLGIFERHWALSLIIGAGVFLTAAYTLSYFVKAFMGPSSPNIAAQIYDLTYRERSISIALAALILWIGLGAGPFINTMRPTLTALYSHLVEAEQVAP